VLLQGATVSSSLLLAGGVAKIQMLLVVGTIASDLMVQFLAFAGSCCTDVPYWHNPTARITIIPIVKVLHGVGGIGTIIGGLGGQGNGSVATGSWSQ